MAIKVLIDAGHGQGSAHNRGYKGKKWRNEGDGNFYFALLLKKELEAYGIHVGLTRTSIGQNPSLTARGNSAKGYDLFMSLHTNAGGGTGVEIYEDVNARATALAKNLCSTIAGTLGIANRGVKYRYNGKSNWYGVLYANKAKAGMLVEHCFHDKQSDVDKYEDRAVALAKNMASNVASNYGLKPSTGSGGGSTVTPPKPQTNTNAVYDTRDTLVIACDEAYLPIINDLIADSFKMNGGAYKNVVVLKNSHSNIKPFENCPYRISVTATASGISTYCNYAIVGNKESIEKGIIEWVASARRKFEASNFR